MAWLRITNGSATDIPMLSCGWRFLGSDQQNVLPANTTCQPLTATPTRSGHGGQQNAVEVTAGRASGTAVYRPVESTMKPIR